MLEQKKLDAPGSTLFKYIVREKSKSVIVISDSEDEDDRRSPSNSPVVQQTQNIQIQNTQTQIIVPGDASDPISLSDSEGEQEDVAELMEEVVTSSAPVEEPQEMVTNNEGEDDDDDEDLLSLSDMMELDFMSDGDMSDLRADFPTAMDALSSKMEGHQMSLFINEATSQETSMQPPATVKTIIQKDTDIAYTLRQIELYIQSVTDISVPYFINETRASRRTRDSSSKSSPEHSTQHEPTNPYVPNRVWYNSTWEDWAQLDVGDILHCPFTPNEVNILQNCVEKQNIKKNKYGRELVDFWQYVSTLLPGRSPLDCRCYWSDFTEGNLILYNNPIIINRQKANLKNSSRHQLLAKRKRTGLMSYNSMRNIHISNMTREHIISEGSGDAIALAVFRDSNGLKIAIGSLCDENTQYNMPGNLRVWDADTKNCSTLKGHYIRNEENGPEIWKTVTDVKTSKDQSLVYTSSHEGSANIWKASTGKLVSTLQYHSKSINQLAVDYSKSDNILASCSNDGSATVWSIGINGKTGSGVICELDPVFFVDPEVDCIEFGRNITEDKLFLGVNNKDFSHPGYIEVYDTSSGIPCNRFNSMKGSVSSMAVSSSGKFVISGNYNRYDNMSGDGFIHLQDVLSKEVTKYYTGHNDVNIVAVSPCDNYIASGNADKEKNEVVIFDVRNPKRVLHKHS
ncbi:WD40-repeat-containing domain protein [Helicostylum pulchrum]|nr:WD40-repeat-containing domain protein [Helicostylum pulchrum]